MKSLWRGSSSLIYYDLSWITYLSEAFYCTGCFGDEKRHCQVYIEWDLCKKTHTYSCHWASICSMMLVRTLALRESQKMVKKLCSQGMTWNHQDHVFHFSPGGLKQGSLTQVFRGASVSDIHEPSKPNRTVTNLIVLQMSSSISWDLKIKNSWNSVL